MAGVTVVAAKTSALHLPVEEAWHAQLVSSPEVASAIAQTSPFWWQAWGKSMISLL